MNNIKELLLGKSDLNNNMTGIYYLSEILKEYIDDSKFIRDKFVQEKLILDELFNQIFPSLQNLDDDQLIVNFKNNYLFFKDFNT